MIPSWRDLTPAQVGGAVRGEIRVVGHRRVSHGLYRPATDQDPMTELLSDLRAWRLVLPPGAVFTHVTGALLRGWNLPRLPETVPVFAAVHGDVSRPRRPGLLCSRLVSSAPVELRHGLPVHAAEEILLRAARDVGVLDLTLMLDAALRMGDIDDSRMETLLGSRRPGVRRLREAWQLSDTRAESPGETVLRLFHEMCGIAVETQVDLFDDAGNALGRADLFVTGTNFVHEYDGEHHRVGKQHAVDLRRERALGSRYQRRGFVLDDLLSHPLTVMHELDRALGRSHSRTRLERWRRLVRHSLYDEATRARLTMRWQQLSGGVVHLSSG